MMKPNQQLGRVSFFVRSIECIACSPVFRRELEHLKGVKSVRPLVMLNKIIIEFDSTEISPQQVKDEVLKVGSKAGLKGKIIFVPK